jgi:hypothetical protein
MGLMDYRARYYSRLLGRFVQPDTIIPEAGNPQAWNRYSYTTNNPINFNDPSGHLQSEDDGVSCQSWECVNDPYVYKKDVTNIKSNKTITKGTIYTSTVVIPYAEWSGSSLASKAEETYTGAGGGSGINYESLSGAQRFFEGIQVGMNIAEDMSYYPNAGNIEIQLNWQQKESGLLIDSLNVKNYAYVGLQIVNVKISGGPSERYLIQGPNKQIGVNGKQPGILPMDINTYLSNDWDSKVHIQFYIAGGYPKDRFVDISFPVGIVPGAGCSYR